MTQADRDSEFAGRRVLVTGGSQGAGAAMIERFAAAGGETIAVARNPPETPHATHFIRADLVDPAGVRSVVEAAQALGASNSRIIFRHVLPLSFPSIIPRERLRTTEHSCSGSSTASALTARRRRQPPRPATAPNG